MTHTFVEDVDVEPSCWSIRKNGLRKLNRVGAVNGVRYCQKTFDSELCCNDFVNEMSAINSSCPLEFSQSVFLRNEDAVDGWVRHTRRLTLPRKTELECKQCLNHSRQRIKEASTQATRDLWWGKLNEVVTSEREKEPKSTNIQVRFNDVSTGIEYTKTFSVGPHDSASRCITLALQHLEMRGRDPAHFQLWAKTSGDEAPYPLIGHERPFAIKLSCLRQGLSAEEGFDLDHCNNLNGPDPYTRCMFILKSKPRLPETPEAESKKNLKKTRKSPMRIRQVFRRSLHKEETDSSGLLFKLPLDKVFEGDLPPKPVMAMFQQVFQKGPFTQGIFRKSASARLVKELREQLDAGLDVALDVVPVLVTAALLKDFLRSLPAPLLGGNLSTDWFDAVVAASPQERLHRIRNLVAQLPAHNQTLLAYFLCVLHHIARRASQNLMTAANLGVCVGPSLLWSPCLTATKAVPLLVETLITHCDTIVGPNVRHLLGDPPERPPDSGAEESDSLHSGGLRRDDSSIDSLERELSEPPRKDKISLSRDSGLTMSDSQLYTPDEEETSSSSSGSGHNYNCANTGYNPASPGYNPTSPPTRQPYMAHSKVSASYSVPANPSLPNLGQNVMSNGGEYVRVYSGWDDRVQGCCRAAVYAPGRTTANPHFQREAWFRQRSTQRRHPRGTGSTPPPDAGSSTLSDDDSTPHVSRSNSRGKDDERVVHAAPATVTVAPPLPPKRAPLRHLPPVHVEDVQDENRPPERRGRLRRRDMAHKALAHRSKSLPPAEDTGSIYLRLQDVEITRSASNKVSVDSPPPYRPPPRAPATYCVDRRVLVDHQEESYV